MVDKLGTSAEAVKKATGRDWDNWIKILDKAGMGKKPHKEVARYLHDKQNVSSWWAQSITVGYEKHHGKRITGQTASAGFEIGVQKTLDMPAKAVWDLLMSPKGLKIWLGDTLNFKPLAGYGYRTKDGISGEIRTVNLGQKLRISWKKPIWRTASVLQIYLLPASNKTSVRFHQERLKDAQQREIMRKHWQEVLAKLQKASG